MVDKKAVIRGENVRPCPFGLPVPEACENAGDAIKRMAHTDDAPDKDKALKKANRLVYAYHKPCEKCPYADKILEEHKKVDCDFGDTGQGQKSVPLIGSPLYPNTFGNGLYGIYSYPMGFYSDMNNSRNLFFGLFSLLGSAIEEIIKLGNEYDKCGEKDKADIVDGLLKKLTSIKEEYGETFDKLVSYMEERREEFESERGDTGKHQELMQQWFAPRQMSNRY